MSEVDSSDKQSSEKYDNNDLNSSVLNLQTLDNSPQEQQEEELSFDEKVAKVDALAESLGINQKKLMWKIDMCVVPPFCLLYFLAFLDRINISNARVYGMATSLNLHGNQFNTALTVFFVPYIFFEILSNYCMKIVKPHLWLSACIFCFGIFTIGMGFVTNFSGLVACRFFLGVFESGSFPAIFYVLSNYYTRLESQRRFSTFFSVVCLAGACGGAIAYRIGVDLVDAHGLESWQYIFIIEGSFTAGLAFLLYFTISDFPEEARFLKQNEKDFLKQKLAIMSGIESGFEIKYNIKDIMNVLKSPGVWIPTLSYFGLVIPSYGYAYFATSIISLMGYTGMELNRHSIYPWLVAFGFSIIMGYLSDRYRIRLPFAVVSCLVAVAGLAMILGVGSGSVHTRYAGCFLSVTGLYTAMPLLICWSSLNFGGHLRKGVGSATIVGCGNIGGIISTWIFLTKDAPLYVPGLSVSILFTVVAMFAIIGYFAWCRYMNLQKQKTSYAEKFFALSRDEQIKAGDLNSNFVYGY